MRDLPLGFKVLKGKKEALRPTADDGEVRDDGDGHLITFAPTGAGKGVSCFVPAVLTWDGPAIVIDPKGENYAVTARWRARMGQKIVVLDPFGTTGARVPDALNPLDLIDADGPCVADDAAVVAKLLCHDLTHPTDKFWDERAETLITGLILYTLATTDGPFRTLGRVRETPEGTPGELRLGYGVRVWSFWQDLSQLQSLYPLDWKSIVNNCAVQQYFGMAAQCAQEADAYLGANAIKPLSTLAAAEALVLRRGQPALDDR